MIAHLGGNPGNNAPGVQSRAILLDRMSPMARLANRKTIKELEEEYKKRKEGEK